MKTHIWLSVCGVAAAVALAACKSGDSPKGSAQAFPKLNPDSVSTSSLKVSEQHEFLTYLKNGLYRTRSEQQYNVAFARDGGMLETTTVDMAMDADSAPASDDGGISSTTTQEQGVDEADLIKYDGNIMYVVVNQGGYNYVGDAIEVGSTSIVADEIPVSPVTPKVRVLQKNSDNSLTSLPDITLANSDSNYTHIKNLYLAEQQLSVIYLQQDQSNVYDIWRPYAQTFNLALFDVQDPQNSAQQENYKIDGYLISSRRIGNTLYLVSSFSPQLNDIGYYAESDQQKAEVFAQIDNLSADDLLPKIVDSSGQASLLVSPENCYLPENATDQDGYDSIVTLTAINLDDPSDKQSVCVNNHVQGVYVSSQAAYLYGSDYESGNSFIHQFSLTNNQVAYLASGEVEGHFGWQQSHLRFSEFNGYLRTVTTEFDWQAVDRYEHRLYILKADLDSKKLDVVSQLPNETNPAAIGKPNEDVYAVRYFGDKAYVVTFERIDPLYVIDLSDVNQPQIAGELEVTGYSSYLHPIGDNLLFAVGREVGVRAWELIDPAPDTAVDVLPEPEAEGTKVVLFDVSDISNPIEVGIKVFDQGYSPAEWDYHALTHLQMSATEHRFSLPVRQRQDAYWQDNQYVYVPDKQQLALFTVNMSDEQGSNAQLHFQGSVEIETNESGYFYGNYNDRSIMHGDILYYLHGHYLWQSDWFNSDDVNGPY